MNDHLSVFTHAMTHALAAIDPDIYDAMADELVSLWKRQGRLFVIGVGGGAANAAHAVNDFRKLCGIETYAPTDGISELTARANDEGWKTIFTEWLHVSYLSANDAILVFSVGGGTDQVSQCIAEAVQMADAIGASILAVVGRSEGAAAHYGDSAIVAEVGDYLRTPVTETLQIAVLHALVSDPRLQQRKTTW